MRLPYRLFFFSLCLPLLGCVSRPSRLPSETFAFAPSAGSPSKVADPQPILVLRSVRVVPAFSGQDFVYRATDYRYERDPYAHFLASPDLLVRSTLSDSLLNSGLFRVVAAGESALMTHSFAEISVRELYGDFRPRRVPAAVLSMRFLLIQSPRGLPLWEKKITRRIPLKERSASALMHGWNTALRQILAEAAPPLAEHIREVDQAAEKAARPTDHEPAPPPTPKS
ncbi:MAG: ABC-type transport auxiliary lipoprotein family protein [Methylacidiphilaceae bacterium]|nr:ABC-type transport auxiliary lipoprotein family protein [Candidatus Methylacidiphilaceae bacterium]